MALQICTTNYNNLISYEQIHAINNHATPKQVMTYKHSLLVYKIWNGKIYSRDWLALNFHQNFNVCSFFIMILETSKIKVEKT